MTNPLPKTCCPTCGQDFLHYVDPEDLEKVESSYLTCPRCDDTCMKDELITEDDDYAWTL